MSETIFDKIISGEIPADILYRDDSVLAFRDINPQAPEHVLVIPLKPIDRFAKLQNWDTEAVGLFFKSVAKVASELNLDGPGYRVVLNNGSNGGQEVEYLHAHILGGRQMAWPPG